ncbi:MAG: putative baseplate assembly protein [Opitutaceae bacterium]
MPIRPPALDDRRYDDLVSELLARIPAHTPEWTNPRVGDPGRTLIELFAWLGDALLYRVNLIPERQRLTFLRLLGQPLRPARPARGLVIVTPRPAGLPAVAHRVRPGASFSGPQPFEAREEFTALPITASAYFKRPILRSEVPLELEALAGFHNSGSAVAGYATTPVFAEGTPPPAGFDFVSDSADRCLWFALFAPLAPDENAQPATNRSVRDALRVDSGQLLNVGFVPALPSADPLEPINVRPPVPHVWEITGNTRQGAITDTRPWSPEYIALDRVDDSTAGLTRAGIIRLQLPAQDVLHAPTNDVRADPDAGVGDRPPRLDDEILGSRLVAWLRIRPAQPATPPPAETQFKTGQGAANLHSSQTGAAAIIREVEHLPVMWAGINAVEVGQFVTRSNLIIGESNGSADQEFALPASSVEPDTLLVQVAEDGGATTWWRVDDLATLDRDAAASRDARVFQLDAESGIIRFGDGVRGRIPPAGRRIIIRQMRSGGGSAGNLPAASLKTVSATSVTGTSVGRNLTVEQPLAFTGGADAETLVEAEKRIPSRLRHRERAVTPDDYRAVARETPGVAVGRVELLPRFKPQQRHDDIPGVVTLMALPSRPLAPAPNPRADRPFLEAIHHWVDARRPLGTEFYTIGCDYVPVAVSLGVSIAAGAPVESTLQDVKDALIRVLWPLPGGGLNDEGWPLGRELSNRELAVEAARVKGISEVAGLNLFRRNVNSGEWERVGDAREGREQNIALERWQLPELLGVMVVAGEAPLSLDPSTLFLDGGSPTNPYADPNARPLTVPIVPEHC